MSSTRNAETGAPLRQERFASSPELQRGLMANLVVKKTETLNAVEDRKLIWALQLYSHQEGGLQRVVDDVVRLYPERIASPLMQKLGFGEGRIYRADEVRMVRKEIEDLALKFGPVSCAQTVEFKFQVYGDGVETTLELSAEDVMIHDEWKHREILAERKFNRAKEIELSKLHPKSYPASRFAELCRERVRDLPEILERVCLDPEFDLDAFTPFFFPTLIATLRDYVAHRIAEQTKGVVMTEIGRIISEECDYASDQRIMALINGHARIGKSFQAQIWGAQNPGSARYIQVPASNDEVGFYRAIARSIGVSINLNSKAHQLRDRIEDVLQSGQLTVVLDEAHFLWPTSNYRGALPRRISWLCTALVNHGVPVVLVTTPQFFIARGGTVEKAHFNADQFDGRLMHYEALPDSLSKEDLAAVAKSLLPEGSEATITGLVSYAQASAKYLAGICAVVTRARYLAKRAGRTTVQAGDVRKAMTEGVLPSDKALAAAVTKADQKTRPKRGPRAIAYAAEGEAEDTFQTPSRTIAEPLQADIGEDTFTGRERPVAATEAPRRGTVPALAEA